MVAWDRFGAKTILLAVDLPPVGGGVSRYNVGLIKASEGRIKVAGIDFGRPAPRGASILARFRQAKWAWLISLRIPRGVQIISAHPHLGVGCALAGKSFVQVIHGGEWADYPLGQKALAIFLRLPRRICVNSLATKNRWIGSNLHQKVWVLRPGLTENIPVRNLDQNPKPYSSDGRDSFSILAVTRLSPRKGLVRLIRAVVDCRLRGLPVELKIVGSGAAAARLEKEIFNESGYVELVGEISDAELLEAYDGADLFVLVPEEVKGGEAWEGFGIVYLEAAARGVPIIATRTGGVPEAVSPEGCVLLPEDAGHTDISAAIEALYLDESKRMEMSIANVGWAQRNVWLTRKPTLDALLNSDS